MVSYHYLCGSIQTTGISNNVAKSFATAATSSGAAAPQLADEENHKQFVEQ